MLYTNNHKERMEKAIENMSYEQKFELLDKLESHDYNFDDEENYGTTAIEVLVTAVVNVFKYLFK